MLKATANYTFSWTFFLLYLKRANNRSSFNLEGQQRFFLKGRFSKIFTAMPRWPMVVQEKLQVTQM